MFLNLVFNLFTISIGLLLHLSFIVVTVSSESFGSETSHRFPIKIINELPSGENNIGLGQFEAESNNNGEEKKPKFNISPAPFSGPHHLETLVGSCFTYLDEQYKYRFCPFNNVTQDDILFLQEAHTGVLGVWGEWAIENNTFKSLYFLEGTKCSSGTTRTVKVDLSCGAANRLVRVREPSKCSYEGLFETPLVCGRNSLVVYPRLPRDLRLRWDGIETERHHGILTQRGYEAELHRLFLRAGYLLPPQVRRSLNKQSGATASSCEERRPSYKNKIEELEREMANKDLLIRNLTNQIEKRNN